MKKFLCFICMILMLVQITGCGKSDLKNYSDVYNEKNIEKNVTFEKLDVVMSVSSFKEMVDESELIIVGNVTSKNEHIVAWDDIDYTKTSVKVEEVIKGDYKEDSVDVLEIGKHIEDGHDFTLDGLPLLTENMRVVLFLERDEYSTEQDAYKISSLIVGKYIIDKDGKVHHHSQVVKEKNDLQNSFSTGYSGLTLDQFKEKINLNK